MRLREHLGGVALIMLASFGSALLCLWLVQSHADRLARDATLAQLREQLAWTGHRLSDQMGRIVTDTVGQLNVISEASRRARLTQLANDHGARAVSLVGPKSHEQTYPVIWSGGRDHLQVNQLSLADAPAAIALLNDPKSQSGPAARVRQPVEPSDPGSILLAIPAAGAPNGRATVLFDLPLAAQLDKLSQSPVPAARPPVAATIRLAGQHNAIAPGQIQAVQTVSIMGQPLRLVAQAKASTSLQALAPFVWRLLFGTAILSLIASALLLRWFGTRRDAGKVNPAVLQTLRQVASGQADARANVPEQSDTHAAAAMLNHVLKKHQVELDNSVADYQELNSAVSGLAQSIAQIADSRDLTKTLRRAPDPTGAIVDAVNELTKRTGLSLARVNKISQKMARLAMSMHSRADNSGKLSRDERQQLSRAANELSEMAGSLRDAQQQWQQSDRLIVDAQQANRRNGQAMDGLIERTEQVGSVIRQTEKQIKRVGERTLEITAAVDSVKAVSKQTGIVALNASLKAAAAGVSGREMALLADEVKRLADASSDSTDHIQELVAAIREDTGHAGAAVNLAMEQTANLSVAIESMNQAVSETEQALAALTEKTGPVAQKAVAKGQVSDLVVTQLSNMQSAGERLNAQMHDQLAQTKRLLTYARVLIEELNAYKTPVLGSKKKPSSSTKPETPTTGSGRFGDAA